jgi:hypothetical protein
MTTVAEMLVGSLAEYGVRSVWGVVGDALNPLVDAIRRDERIDWIGVRHEEAGAFAAGAQAQLTPGVIDSRAWVVAFHCALPRRAGSVASCRPPAFHSLRQGDSVLSRRVVLYQKPNATLTMVGLLIGASRVLHAVDAGTPFDIFLERAATAMLLWWSVDEMVRGTTTYRKTIGGVTLAAAVLRTVVAEGSRARSPA